MSQSCSEAPYLENKDRRTSGGGEYWDVCPAAFSAPVCPPAAYTLCHHLISPLPPS